ncbi:MAG: branched-chain amino acid ABC transporter permease, partial [Thermoleophilum sp.]|nr:branched-chain amino acid ABC transporter permease [Thermoleophilum sp.]
MERLAQTIVDGIADGSLYAALALALVLIFRTTGVVNFAQGEMAMVSTFVAWSLLEAGLPLGAAIAVALAFAFVFGMALERIVIRPVEGRGPLTLAIVTLGLYILLNSAAGWIWGFNNRGFPSVFPSDSLSVGGVDIAVESLGIVVVLLVVVAALFLLLERTRIGLALRAVST